MNFLWSLFRKGLEGLLFYLAIWASKTKREWDDDVMELAQKVGEIFVFGKLTEDGLSWEIPPVTDPLKKASAVKAVTAVMNKEMFIDPEFQKLAGLTETQAGTTLVAILSYLKPDAVDTEEEIQKLLKEAQGAEITSIDFKA